jgi:general secretion pathway protein J
MKSQGFTLLELILSLTILAMIIVIVSGGFQLGVRAYEKGGQMIDTQQRERISAELMKHQLASLYISKPLTDKAKTGSSSSKLSKKKGKEEIRTSFFLKGNKKRISFLSSMPIISDKNNGMVYAVYSVRSSGSTERLIFYEKNISLLGDIADISDIDFYDLIPETHSVEFGYLKEEGKWLDAYDSNTEKMPPKAIRIAIRRSQDSPPLYIIARIVQTPDNEKAR